LIGSTGAVIDRYRYRPKTADRPLFHQRPLCTSSQSFRRFLWLRQSRNCLLWRLVA